MSEIKWINRCDPDEPWAEYHTEIVDGKQGRVWFSDNGTWEAVLVTGISRLRLMVPEDADLEGAKKLVEDAMS